MNPEFEHSERAAPRPVGRSDCLSVSELNRAVAGTLERAFALVQVAGEVSNFVRAASGHWYFSLKDDAAQVRCAMFRGRAQYVGFVPREGDAVELRAQVRLYEARGEYQLVVDALRPDQVATHHPGETTIRMADIAVINKVDAATATQVQRAVDNVRGVNPLARIVRAASPVLLDDAAAVKGRRVLVVEDGPTITHGGMPYGAGYVAAQAAGALGQAQAWGGTLGGLSNLYGRYQAQQDFNTAMQYGTLPGSQQTAMLRAQGF